MTKIIVNPTYVCDPVHICDIKFKFKFSYVIAFFQNVFAESALNAFMGLSHMHWAETRETLKKLLSADNAGSPLRTMPEAVVKMSRAKMHLPASIGDYTDFYSSVDHARNVGVRKSP